MVSCGPLATVENVAVGGADIYAYGRRSFRQDWFIVSQERRTTLSFWLTQFRTENRSTLFLELLGAGTTWHPTSSASQPSSRPRSRRDPNRRPRRSNCSTRVRRC